MKRTILTVLAAILFPALAFAVTTIIPVANFSNAFPPKKPNLGEKTIACIAVQWKNNNNVTAANCGNMVGAVKSFYERNSRNKLTLKASTGVVHMDINDGPDQINAGEDAALKKFPGFDYYIIPNTANSGPNHSSGHIAHMNQVLNTVAEHETGHLLGLGHAQKVDGCCDKESIMNPESKPSSFLTAPQYYYLGWMTNDEYTLYTQPQSFELKHPLDANPGIAAVIVSPQSMGHDAGARFAFVSFAPKCFSGDPCVAIHLANEGGSILVKEVALGNSYYDGSSTGLNVSVGSSSPLGVVKVDLSINPVALKEK